MAVLHGCKQYRRHVELRWRVRLCAALFHAEDIYRLLVGFPFLIHKGLWPSVPVLVGNATLTVSKYVYA
jgi:hypothetical protein